MAKQTNESRAIKGAERVSAYVMFRYGLEIPWNEIRNIILQEFPGHAVKKSKEGEGK